MIYVQKIVGSIQIFLFGQPFSFYLVSIFYFLYRQIQEFFKLTFEVYLEHRYTPLHQSHLSAGGSSEKLGVHTVIEGLLKEKVLLLFPLRYWGV